MALNGVSGSLLDNNLLRNGVDLAFETNLLYLNVVNGRVGIKNGTPVVELDVTGSAAISSGLTVGGTITTTQFKLLSSSAGQVIYSNGLGIAAGSTSLTFNDSTYALTVGGTLTGQGLTLTGTAITPSTGVAQVTGTGSLVIPVGTTAQQPSSYATPVVLTGQIRWNSDTSAIEVYDGGAWNNIATQSYVSANFVADTGGTITGDLTIASLNSGQIAGFRNKVINGAMEVDQRALGSAVANTTASTYLCDRFFSIGSVAGKFTAGRSTGTVPPNFIAKLGAVSSSAYTVAATDKFLLGHIVEGSNMIDFAWGSAQAKTVTLSFYAYSSLTGTFAGSIRDSVASISYPFTYTIPTANTWQYVSITVPGPSTGTWTTNNTASAYISWDLGTGSTFQGTAGTWNTGSFTSVAGANSIVSTLSATFNITGVQIEIGSQATPFEHRLSTAELALCQRYFYAQPPTNPIYSGYAGAASIGKYVSAMVPVTMRTTPTADISAVTWFTTNVGTPSVNVRSAIGWDILATSSAAGECQFYASSGNITFNAEL